MWARGARIPTLGHFTPLPRIIPPSESPSMGKLHTEPGAPSQPPHAFPNDSAGEPVSGLLRAVGSFVAGVPAHVGILRLLVARPDERARARQRPISSESLGVSAAESRLSTWSERGARDPSGSSRHPLFYARWRT